jgi:hypothetical protein
MKSLKIKYYKHGGFMKTIILTIIACTLSISAFAAKIFSPNDEYVKFSEWKDGGCRNYSTQFTIKDRDNTYYHYTVAYNLNINSSLCGHKCDLYMQFLDKNDMLLHEEYLGTYDANFIGIHRDIIKLGKNVLYDAEDVVLIQRAPSALRNSFNY